MKNKYHDMISLLNIIQQYYHIYNKYIIQLQLLRNHCKIQRVSLKAIAIINLKWCNPHFL